jgi:hypothetical protein
MNAVIQELVQDAGFMTWADEEWGPGPGHIDWNAEYSQEFDLFLTMLSDRIYKAVMKQCNVDDHSDSLDIAVDRAWQLGFNAGLIVAAAEANKILTEQ